MRALLALAVIGVTAPLPGQSGTQGGRAAFESWNLAYVIPAGWQLGQQVGRVHTLMTPAALQGPVIYVAPGMHQSFTDAAVDLNKGFNTLGLTGTPVRQPVTATVAGMQAMTADYLAQSQTGLTLQAHVVSVITSHGTGLLVLGFAPAAQPGEMPATVDRIAQSLEVSGPPQPNQQAIAALRGRWMLYEGRASGVTSALGGSSRGHEEFVEFDGVGRFAFQSSSSVSVTTPGLSGSAGGAQSTSDEGTYTVIGTTLVVRGRQGQSSFDLQILSDRVIADGRTYLRAN